MGVCRTGLSVPAGRMTDMEISTVLALLIGVLVGAGAALALHRARRQAEVARDDAETERARAEVSEARRESAAAREETARVRSETERLRADTAAARTETAEAIAARAELSATLAATQTKLTAADRRAVEAEARADQIAADREAQLNQFKVLSESTLEAQGRKADQSADARLKATEQLMGPVAEGLRQLQDRLTAVEKDRVALSTDLRNQVQAVQATGEHLRRETHALVTALRKPQVRGNWGELQLKNAAELANMRQHCDFDVQHSTTTTGGAGIRPDMRVNLSDGKCLFVDSKVPLEGFLDAHDSDDDGVREAALDRFGAAVRSHVDQLSAKQYWAVDDQTPEFVVMFLPSEALAAEALGRMPDLHEYAARKGIVIASPSTLIALLRTVAHSWKQSALAQNAKEVADLGRELFQRLATMGGHFDRLGRQLTGAVTAYNKTLGSLEGRVLVAARRLNELDVTDAELAAPGRVDPLPRQVTSPELVEDASQVTPMIGRGEATLPEASALVRPDPALDDLADDTLPLDPLSHQRRSS